MMNTTTATTVQDYLDMGYIKGECKLERGYLSRKGDYTNPPVIMGGRHKNRPYYNLPRWDTTRYITRIYLVKKGA